MRQRMVGANPPSEIYKMDIKTNIERVENMLFHICGCTDEEAIEVCLEVIMRAKKKTI